MVGKVQTDHASMCAAYRAGEGQVSIAARFGVSVPTVIRAAMRGMTDAEREAMRKKRHRDGAALRAARAQQQKIERGDFVITRSGDVLIVEVAGYVLLFDACDEHLLSKSGWQVSHEGRLMRGTKCLTARKNIYIYHDILGVQPARDLVVDHINRNPRDNRRANLRLCTYSENALNRGPRVLHGTPNNPIEESDCG